MFSRLNPYLFWIKAGAIVALLAAVWGWGYYTKALACEAALQSAEAAQLAARLAERDYWQARAAETDEALRKALDRKPAAPRVREVVRANPSGCNLPVPVGDGLREQIDRANKAASAK